MQKDKAAAELASQLSEFKARVRDLERSPADVSADEIIPAADLYRSLDDPAVLAEFQALFFSRPDFIWPDTDGLRPHASFSAIMAANGSALIGAIREWYAKRAAS